jgi:hypothetical protein
MNADRQPKRRWRGGAEAVVCATVHVDGPCVQIGWGIEPLGIPSLRQIAGKARARAEAIAAVQELPEDTLTLLLRLSKVLRSRSEQSAAAPIDAVDGVATRSEE